MLIVRIGAMGDVLHAMPAAAALRQAHPEWEIGWVVEPRWLPLLRAGSAGARGPEMPLVDRVYLAATRKWKREPFSGKTVAAIRSLVGGLRRERFDVCVDMQGAIRSAVIGRFAAAGRFVGPAEPRERQAQWLYSERVQTVTRHVVEQGCELLGAAVGERLAPAEVPLPVDATAESACSALLARLPHRGRFAVIAASAGWGAKQWPAERYGAVAKELSDAGYGVVVNAASHDDVLAQRVVETSGGRAVAVHASLAQLIALTRRASVVIAGDTGPLHLAAALGRPVVGIYGPTDPARNGPYGTEARVLRHVSSRTDHSRYMAAEAGLLEITPEEVIEAALELLETHPENSEPLSRREDKADSPSTSLRASSSGITTERPSF
ncbi:MAG TPA: lipopolysaccharide heptosyltransferase I [Edaphobacter sp.]